MVQNAPTNHADLDNEVSRYLNKIRQIDRIVQRPVETLIRVNYEAMFKPSDGAPNPTPKKKDEFYLPALLSVQADPRRSYYPLTQALCFATLQKLWRRRRRFSWLERNQQLKALLQKPPEKDAPNWLLWHFLPEDKTGVDKNLRLLQSDVFGGLNPFTAAQVFRVLVEGGEAQAHSATGCLAFFAMVWSLYRSYPDPGARIEPWHPTAYVTANCLLPILGIIAIAKRRAQVLEDIAKNLDKLDRTAIQDDPHSHWLFNVQLDALSANLLRLSELAIVKEEFKTCAEKVSAESKNLNANNETKDYKLVYARVLRRLTEAIRITGEQSEQTLNEALKVIGQIDQTLIQASDQASTLGDPSGSFKLLEDLWKVKFAEEYKQDADCRDSYWKDVAEAAGKAVGLSRGLLSALARTAELCSKCTCKIEDEDSVVVEQINSNKGFIDDVLKPALQTIKETIEELAKANHDAARSMESPVQAPARWCRSVVDREIAHASAGNVTDFDPSELVSAIAVAVRCKLMTTSLQVADAIGKAILGVQEDGSWRAGHPFYSPNDALGLWPVTSDIVWTLAGTIEQQPEVSVADEKLFHYVDWLERTLIEVPVRKPTKGEQNPQRWTGWASDRLGHRKIHLVTTAYSINALLEIRELVEYRLWEFCKKRFATPPVSKGLADVDPVDLGAKHEHRLHSRLATIARQAQDAKDDAAYSLVLHGPPGSSKTRLAEALSVEIWKGSRAWGSKEPRLIRVTPADFTRLGEDRLDSEARLIFDLLGHVRAVTILFDEIDDLLRWRDTGEPARFMDLVVPSMLNRLADLRSACPRQEICFLLAMNYIESVERALIRKGRIDHPMAVVYPDEDSRHAMIHSRLHEPGKKAGINVSETVKDFIKNTKGWPWMTIDVACKEIVGQLNNNDVKWNYDGFKALIARTVIENQSLLSQPQYEERFGNGSSRRNNRTHCRNVPGQLASERQPLHTLFPQDRRPPD